MLFLFLLILIVLLIVRGNPFPQAGYVFSPLDVVLLILLILLIVALFGGLGPHSRWFW